MYISAKNNGNDILWYGGRLYEELEALNPSSAEWRHHTNISGDHQLVDIFVKKYFDVEEDISLQDYILKSQVIQAEMMRHVYDELRSRKFRCSGVIDYYLAKRPIYYYLKRALAPINVSFRGYEVQNFDGMANYKEYYKGTVKPIEILVTGDMLGEKEVLLEYKVLNFEGCELKSGTTVKVLKTNSVEKMIDVDISDIQNKFVPEETILYVQIKENEQILNENRYFFAPYRELKLKPALVKYNIRMLSDTKAEMTLSADTFVWMLHLAISEGVEFNDNDFDLLVNSQRAITIQGENVKDYVPQIYSLNPRVEVCAE